MRETKPSPQTPSRPEGVALPAVQPAGARRSRRKAAVKGKSGTPNNPTAGPTASAGSSLARPCIYKAASLSPAVVDAVRKIEAAIGRPVFLVFHGDGPPVTGHEGFYHPMLGEIVKQRSRIPREQLTVVLNSPGGQGDPAYWLARFFQEWCGSYEVLVPTAAKSAATLFALGAARIILGRFGELGPLDVQIRESSRKDQRSALDEVQSLQHLQESCVEALDLLLVWCRNRFGLKPSELEEFLPDLQKYVALSYQPLFGKIDVVHWTQQARTLKIGLEYAWRLLDARYGTGEAIKIARTLVHSYPDHGFVIDFQEASRIGLKVEQPKDALLDATDALFDALLASEPVVYIGYVDAKN